MYRSGVLLIVCCLKDSTCHCYSSLRRRRYGDDNPAYTEGVLSAVENKNVGTIKVSRVEQCHMCRNTISLKPPFLDLMGSSHCFLIVLFFLSTDLFSVQTCGKQPCSLHPIRSPAPCQQSYEFGSLFSLGEYWKCWALQ